MMRSPTVEIDIDIIPPKEELDKKGAAILSPHSRIDQPS